MSAKWKRERIPIDEVQTLPGLEPKHDNTFLRLAGDALEGAVPVYFATVPLGLCVPFDLDYRPDVHPIGKTVIEHFTEQAKRHNFQPMIAYPRGKWFVIADDYGPLFAALAGRPDYVPCFILGKPENDLIKDVQGPLDSESVRRILGFS